MDFENDPIGKAIYDFQHGMVTEPIIVHSDLCEDDEMQVGYLFRDFENMPPIEKKALQLCKGKVLDVGAAAGCHAKWLLDRNMEVLSIDTSKGAISFLEDENYPCQNIDFHQLNNIKFDTILFLMNGIGIAGKLDRLKSFLSHAKSLLNDGGQIICDSTDIQYLYEDNEGGQWIDLNSQYYGEMEFQMEYKNTTTSWFPWLYIDFNLLQEECNKTGLHAEQIMTSENNHYLAKITIL